MGIGPRIWPLANFGLQHRPAEERKLYVDLPAEGKIAEIKAIKRRQSPLAGLLAGKLDHVIGLARPEQLLKLSHPLLEVRSSRHCRNTASTEASFDASLAEISPRRASRYILASSLATRPKVAREPILMALFLAGGLDPSFLFSVIILVHSYVS